MKRMYIGGLISGIALMTMGTVASAADITLCAGSAGRNYDSVMKGIGNELTQRGHNVKIANLKGSEDILNGLDRGTCNYGIAQKDVYYKLSRANAALTSSTTAIALAYNEVMTMMCSEQSGIDELDEVTKDTTVIIDVVGSGSALTWETMVAIEKEFGRTNEWSTAQVEYTALDESLASISLGNADCAFGVGALPSNWATSLNQEGLVPVYIYDKDLNDLIVNKTPLYGPLRIAKGAYTTKFDTYVIPAVIFRGNKLPIEPDVDSIVKKIGPNIGKKFATVK